MSLPKGLKEIYALVYRELWQRQPEVVSCRVYFMLQMQTRLRMNTYIYITYVKRIKNDQLKEHFMFNTAATADLRNMVLY